MPLSPREELEALRRAQGADPAIATPPTLRGESSMSPAEELTALRLAQDPNAARAQAWREQAEQEGPGTKLAIGAASAVNRLLRGLGAPHTAERVVGSTAEDLAAARQGAGGWGTAGEFGTDVAMLAAPGGALARGITKAAPYVLPRAMAALGPAGVMAAPFAQTSALPYIAAAGSGAALGAAATPGSVRDRATAAGFGAAGGALGQGIAQGVGRAVAPSTRTLAARQMLEEGVPLTPGQYRGGLVAEVEKGLTHTPIVGRRIEDLQDLARQRWLSNLMDDVNPLKGEVAITKQGHQGVAQLADNFDQAYARYLHGQTVQHGKPTFDALMGVWHRNSPNLTKEGAEAFSETGNNLAKEIFGPNFAGRELTGSLQRQLEKNLAGKVSSALESGDNVLAQAYIDLLGTFKASRNAALPPEVAQRLAQIDNAYGKFKVIEHAAGRAGAVGGELTPKQLYSSAVQNVGGAARGRGNAPLVQEAQTAMDVLSPSSRPGVANPWRLLMPLGAGVGAYEAYQHPSTAAAVALGAVPAVMARRPMVAGMNYGGRALEAGVPSIARSTPHVLKRAMALYAPGLVQPEPQE